MIRTDIFLNYLIRFYSNNTTNLHYFTSHERRVAPQHRDRNVTTDYCGVASPYFTHLYPQVTHWRDVVPIVSEFTSMHYTHTSIHYPPS